MGFSHGSLRRRSWHQNIVKQAFWVPLSFLRGDFLNPISFLKVESWVFYCLPIYARKIPTHFCGLAGQIFLRKMLGNFPEIFGPLYCCSSKPKGPGEKGAPRNHPESLCLRNGLISSADFPMTPMEGTDTFWPFLGEGFGAISGGPFFSRPLCFTADCRQFPPRIACKMA